MALLDARMLLDGAVGTELMALGLRPREECPEGWNLARPRDVSAIHAAYFEAGAAAVQTNTFGANRLRLATFGRAGEVRALNVAGALLAREVRPAGRRVIGSLGPTGAIPPPEGRADLVELEDVFAEQAMALAEGGVDLLHVETLYHPKEARAALRGCALGAPGLPVMASMTCQLAPGGYATPLGFSPELMLAVFLEEEVDAVGLNCTLGPVEMLELVRLLRGRMALPIACKPTPAMGAMQHLGPGALATGALALLAAGATAVGGCCGSTPADIAAIRGALDGDVRLEL
jgi:5-methyltetrahydrofolate--homocysteine methyltransferase